MTTFEAPAKLNLSLLVSPPRSDGYHPLASLVQTIDWCDLLEVEVGEGRDDLEPEMDDDLVGRALAAARRYGVVPPLRVRLDKQIPVAAGLGGGSADAAAALLAASRLGDLVETDIGPAAAEVGADVPLFLVGGTLSMTGIGEVVEPEPPAADFAVAVVVPEFGLSTSEVYRRWDDLEGPQGDAIDEGMLPPSIRGRMPMRNDLLPAALDLEPLLGDFMADVSSLWGTPLALTGSGSSCFGYFPTLDEATDAAAAVPTTVRAARGVALRDHGVAAVQ